MANYFYSLNDSGELQISDDTVLQMISRTDTIPATNINNGTLYGYSLDSNAFSAAFSLNGNGTLFVSPQGINSNGSRWYLVGSNTNNTIEAKQIVINNNISPASSPFAGMEIYNASGKVVYSTRYELMSMETFCHLPYKFSNFSNGGGVMEFESLYDDGYMVCPGNLQPGLAIGFFYDHGVTDNLFYKPLGQHGVDNWSYTARSKPYVQPLMTPWFPSMIQSDDGSSYRYAYMCGFNYSGNTISLQNTVSKYLISSYSGLVPNFNTIKVTGDGMAVTEGVCATSYMVNILTRF